MSSMSQKGSLSGIPGGRIGTRGAYLQECHPCSWMGLPTLVPAATPSEAFQRLEIGASVFLAENWK